MSCLQYQDNQLFIENVSLESIANEFGTPTYVYSSSAVESNWKAFDHAFDFIPHRICYAVKANSNIAILHLLTQLNSGFDIVSVGELERVLHAGGDPKKIVFSGVGKKQIEIERAIKAGIYCFNVESSGELERLQAIANHLGAVVNIALRINPDVNPYTHAHISTGLIENKFGIELSEVIPLCKQLASMPALRLIGIACHIGSQITQLEPFLMTIDRMLAIYTQLQSLHITIQHINIGGGLGIRYRDEEPPTIHAYAQALQEKLGNLPIELIVEPGRAIVGDAGVLLTRVEYLKYTKLKNFAIVDAGMNDLVRPALYGAWQPILPVRLHTGEKKQYDIAGPVCESADFLGKDRELILRENDLLAVDSVGAYGFSMSSNYNSRGRPAEILVEDNTATLIRPRETVSELFLTEKSLSRVF